MWTDAGGEEHRVAEDVIERLESLLGEPPTRPTPLVVRRGADVGRGTVRLEDGGTADVAGLLPADFPLGYHRIEREDGDRALIVSPGRCHVSERREWGWSAQLYATRSTRSWGIGDLDDLRTVGRSAAGSGAGFVMINPLHAAAPGVPQEASPYSPTSRRFRNPLYLSVDAVAAQVDGASDHALAELARGRPRAEREPHDRPRPRAAGQARSPVADLVARAAPPSRAARPPTTHRCASSRCGRRSPSGSGRTGRPWPAEYHRPDAAEVEEFARANDDRVRFHAWLQRLMEQQLRSASDEISIVQDLPIGFHSTGADAWAWQDLIVRDASVGAPPDEFNRRGQDWGLPPFNPLRLRDAEYGPFIETIRSTMPHRGGLRVDHVMGLFRLWWVPVGNEPTDGGYVRSFASDLLDIVALESVRHEALVVGEDLGTVEESSREQLAAHEILSYRLLWFEPDPPEQWPERAMAAITTHDLPTVVGMWDHSDLEEQHELGLDVNEEGQREIRDRLEEITGLSDDAAPDDVVVAAHEALGRAPCRLVCATLDDACLEPRRPNVPGADRSANWSLALPVSLEELLGRPITRRLAAALTQAVAGSVPGASGAAPVDHTI